MSPAPEFAPGAWTLAEPYIDPLFHGVVRAVFDETARSMSDAGVLETNGRLSYRLALALGARPSVASRLGRLLDLLQVAIDVTDNIADDLLDEALGCGLEARYPEVPRESLVCVPALLMGCIFTELARGFRDPDLTPDDAARRLSRALSAMALGQGLDAADSLRVDLISGRQGALLCLPLWVGACPAVTQDQVADIERWAVAYGRLWQLSIDARERSDRGAQAAFEQGLGAARRAWPNLGPFLREGDFSADRLLPRGDLN